MTNFWKKVVIAGLCTKNRQDDQKFVIASVRKAQQGEKAVYAENVLVHSKVVPFLPLTLTKVPIPFVRGSFYLLTPQTASHVKSSCARTLRYQFAGKLKSFCDSCHRSKPILISSIST